MLAIFFNINKYRRLSFLISTLLLFTANSYFSQKASVFENISESDGLPSNYVFNASEDQNHIVWFGTDKGLVTYQDGKWIALDADNGMPGNYINKTIADKKNGLLINFSEKGLYFFNTNTKTLMRRYNVIDGKQVLNMQTADINNNYIIIRTRVIDINKEIFYAFDRNNIHQLLELKVFNKNNDTLLQLNNGKTIAHYKIFDNNPKLFFENYSLLASSNGVIRYQNNKIIDTLSEKNGLVNNFVSNILKRENGDIYISTLGGGVSVLKKSNSKVSFINNNTNVRDIIYNNGKAYILADGYLYVLNNQFVENKFFLRKDALSFYITGNELYVGNFDGLYIYGLSPKPILKKIIPMTIGISKITKIENKIILSTYGNGIIEINENNKKIIKNKPFNNIENLFKLKKGYALLSYEYGASIIDDNFKFISHFNKKNGLESNYSTYAFSDNDTIYIGTKKGVTLFFNGKAVSDFNYKNGYKGNITKLIFRDNKKQIWVLTDKFLLRKIGNTLRPLGSIRLLDDANDRVMKGQYSASNNTITIVSKRKFSIININKIAPDNHPYPVILEEITSDGKVISKYDNVIFEDHNENIYFIFKSIDKEILMESKLYYKVNDGIWKPFTQPRVLKFSHLERGNYKVFIKNVNADGFESFLQKPIEFKVLGPFYIRWWFILISSIFASFFIYNYANEQNKKKYVKRLNNLRIKNQIDNERKRIGRDLHDNIGAYVTSLISKIDLLKNNNSKELSESNYDDVRLDAEHILALLRQTIYVLANKETTVIALYDNFKSYAQKFLQTNNVRIIFEENVEINRTLDPSVSSGIFRIMQEALQNIHKHASATKVEINVISKDKLVIFIKDNGKGFKDEELKFGYGIKNMKERAMEIGFKFNIYSDKTGTTIELYES